MQDEQDNVMYKLSEKASGTGTRQSGAAIRNEIMNILRQSNSIVVLSFEGVSVVSSSFADELVGKLAAECGLITFMQRFRLVGMNETVQAIMNRSVTQRIGSDPSQWWPCPPE
jgi:anti-anti-sigma regulatory factor